jgi:hypothetical protein
VENAFSRLADCVAPPTFPWRCSKPAGALGIALAETWGYNAISCGDLSEVRAARIRGVIYDRCEHHDAVRQLAVPRRVRVRTSEPLYVGNDGKSAGREGEIRSDGPLLRPPRFG